MSKREEQAAFVRALIVRAGAEERRRFPERITQAERNERSCRRAFWLVVLLALFSAAGLCYSLVMLPELFRSRAHIIVRCFTGLGLASLVCAMVYFGCWLWHRALLNQLLKESRRLILKSLASHPSSDVSQAESGQECPSAADWPLGATTGDGAPAHYRSYRELFSFGRIS